MLSISEHLIACLLSLDKSLISHNTFVRFKKVTHIFYSFLYAMFRKHLPVVFLFGFFFFAF